MTKIISKEIEKQVCEDYINNFTYKKISTNNGISEPSILKILKRNNIEYRGKRKYTCNDNYFENIDTPDKAYFMGFILGDGYLRQRGNVKTIKLQLQLIDKEILEKFKYFIEASNPVIEASRVDKNSNKKTFSCNFELSSNKLFDDLVRHGVRSTKSKDCSFSKNISDNLMVHYVRGLIDSDGGWCLRKTQQKNLNFSFVSSVYQFVFDFRSFLIEKCGLDKVKINSQINNKAHVIYYGGNVQTKKIYDYLYSSGGPWLDRKYELTTNYFNNTVIRYSNSKNIRKLNIQHSYSKYVHNVCRCDVCHLCHNMYNRYKDRGIYLLTTIVSELSTKYLEVYKDDYSHYKNYFYNKIDEELNSRKLIENIITNTNFND